MNEYLIYYYKLEHINREANNIARVAKVYSGWHRSMVLAIEELVRIEGMGIQENITQIIVKSNL